MIQITRKLMILCLLLCIPFAGAYSKETKKTATKNETFHFSNISEDAVLKLSNDFGDITIVHWEKDEISFHRKLTIGASSAENAQKRLESRVLKYKQSGNVYSFTLEFPNVRLNKDSYDINDEWIICVPRDKMSFDITNRYGGVNFTKNFRCKSLKTFIQFGNVNIREVHSDKGYYIDVAHGSVNLQKANNVTLKSGYSRIEMGQVDTLSVKSNFDTVNIKQLATGFGQLSFCNFAVASLEKKLVISKCSHGSVSATLSNGKEFQWLQVSGSHTPIDISFSDKINARYSITNRYGNINLKSGAHSTYQQEGGTDNGFTSHNNGYVGNGVKANANAYTHANTHDADKSRNITKSAQISLFTEHADITM